MNPSGSASKSLILKTFWHSIRTRLWCNTRYPALVQIPRDVEVDRCRAVRQSCVQHGIPNFGRNAALAAQATERELILSNSMLQFDASDRDGGVVEILEPEHRTGPCLHASMVLLDQVVQYFDDLTFVRFQRGLSREISRTARCDAA
jgi:hypothetical protein